MGIYFLPRRACLGQGTATASASAVTRSRSVVHNLPFGVDRGGRGMNCMWGVHRLPRFPDSCSIGSFCMTAGGRRRRRRHQRRDLPALQRVRGTEVDTQLLGNNRKLGRRVAALLNGAHAGV
jgi:hypothetical protein